MSRSRSALPAQNTPAWAAALGERLRRLRTERAVTLATVSDATGISASFLSLLEQGRTDVSLGRLLPLLDYYGLELGEVVPSGPRGNGVVRRDEREVVFSPADGIDVYLAAPDRRRGFVPLIVEYAPGAVMEGWSEHNGEEFVLVLGGAVVVEFAEGETVRLEEGDSVFFTSSRGHRLSAADDRPARTIVVTRD